MGDIKIRTTGDGVEISWFGGLCNGDYEYLGVPDGNLRSNFNHCKDILLQAEKNGFDNILLPSSYQVGQDVLSFASALAPMTESIYFLTALRMGELHPPMLARAISTLDHILKGRLTINIINSDLPGNKLASEKRYLRACEVVQILKQAWTSNRIEFQGQFYQLNLETEPVKPYQQNGGPLLYFGGISEQAKNLCAKHCDVFLMWPETKEKIYQTMKDMSEKAHAFGRKIDFGFRVHVIVRETEKEAKAYAQRILSKLDQDKAHEIKHRAQDSSSAGVLRQDALRMQADTEGYIEPHLWSGIGQARSGCGSAIVGNPDQVRNKLQSYIDMGIKSFILSGYPLMGESDYVSRYVLPTFKQEKLAVIQKRTPLEVPTTPLTTKERV
ncbi:MAG: alkanesulfonate monooxygenase [Zetaproteobacteria bacterium]|nr:alkanesulfonate monooxygenase [Pseudobdellovibrionaceae bacterium]